ncbi:MAG: aspartate carbamoyltransferase regulatory subunit [Candidatus Aenigmarchaeota archaeon]
MTDEREMHDKDVYFIKNGLTVDHLLPGTGGMVKHIIGVKPTSSYDGFHSEKHGKKDRVTVPIEGFHLTDDQKLMIALVSPRNTISEIEGGEAHAKYHARVPDEIRGHIECPNDNCITNAQDEDSRAYVEERNGEDRPETFRCHYCETPFGKEELKFTFL